MDTGRSSKVVLLFGDKNVGGRKSLACHDYQEVGAPKSAAINSVVYLFDGKTHSAEKQADAVGLYDYDTVKELQGRLSGIVDAMFGEKTQREALKRLITSEIWDMYHDRTRLFEYEYWRLNNAGKSGSN